MLTLEQRLAIGDRAATLDERLARVRSSASGGSGTAPDFDSAPLRSWQRAFSGDDRAAFVRRLSWDGLEPQSAAAALTQPLAGRSTPPAWTTWLQRFGQHAAALARDLSGSGVPPELAWVSGGATLTGTRPHDASPEPPFIELWIPMVRAIHAELRYAGRALVSSLATSVRHGLQRAWLTDLAAAGGHAAWVAFERFTPPAADAVAERPPWYDGQQSARYDAFISHQLQYGLAPLFRDYPVLARDLALIAETSLASSIELLRRLDQDREAIARRFVPGRPLGDLTDLRASLSDPHGGRRRVCALTFESGLRLVYKPRDVTLDRGFDEMVEWLRGHGLGDAPATAAVLAGDRYGWIELVRAGTCTQSREVERAFDAAGVLLCLTWVLGARDLHWQNVIATARGPVLVDLETLLSPGGIDAATQVPASSERAPSSSAAAVEAPDACLESGLLSCLQMTAGGDVTDVGGLRGRADRLPEMEVTEWTGVRRDTIKPTTVRRQRLLGPNSILLNGDAVDPAAYARTLLQGFRRAYLAVLSQRQALAGERGLLARWFGGGWTRVVLRPSQRYGRVLAALHDPAFLRDGVARCIALETLNRPFSSSHERPQMWPLAIEERRALGALDVPRFTTRADERSVREARDAGDLFGTTGLGAASARLAAMSDRQLRDHERAIAEALETSPSTRYANPPPPSSLGERDGHAHSTAWLEAALWVAEEILRHEAPRGGSSTPLDEPSAGSAIRRLGLYEGTLGVALFFAALRRQHPDPRFDAVVSSALLEGTGVVTDLASSHDDSALPVGATSGIGSIALAATFLAHVDPTLKARALAEQAAGLLDGVRLQRCDASDVVGGAAGAILALLAVRGLSGDRRWLDQAVTAGDLVLDRAVRSGTGHCWPWRDGRIPIGFGHGNSGIAAALFDLAAASGQSRVEQAALSALELERPFYSPVQRTWPAFADASGGAAGVAVWMNAWCYGAAGMSISRLKAWQATRNPRWKSEAISVLDDVAQAPASMAEHLCCGNLGRAEILLSAAQWLGDSELADRSRRLAAAALERSSRRGHVALSASGFTYVTSRPGLFQGLAGVGYHWLRQQQPALPGILALSTASIPETISAGRTS